jgi:FkbM family methyltransferase
MIHSAIGRVGVGEGGKKCILTEAGDIGFALFGPYVHLGPGDYSVIFDARIPTQHQEGCRDDAICAYIEVTAAEGRLLFARRPLFASALKNGATHSLDFQVNHPNTLEFRIYATGASPLVIAADRSIVVSPSRGRFSPILPNDDAVHNPFFAEHFHSFVDLHWKGACIRPNANATEVTMFGISMNVSNYDDLQMIQEILIGQAYNFVPSREVCVLDVGMNVGLASLFFARMDRVKAVYSFEPVPAPFRRALENIALNPTLAEKIKPSNFGLGAKDEELEVMCDDAHTIDFSVRGSLHGKRIKINLRDAASVMKEIVAEADSHELDVVVKLDCEGSEFPIIDTLSEADLLRRPRIYMMEWHKTWAPEKTQDYIISRLTTAGFEVFDRTNPFDPYAGLIYAARSQ